MTHKMPLIVARAIPIVAALSFPGNTLSEGPRTLQSSAGNVSCTLTQDKLVFTDGKTSYSITLDFKPREPQEIKCSGNYSVIVEPARIIVSLGTEALTSKRLILGMIGDDLSALNSYALVTQRTKDIKLEGPILAFYNGEERERVDLSNP